MTKTLSKKPTTSYRQLRITELSRANLLLPGQSFIWSWLSNGEVVARIRIAVENRHSLRLNYRTWHSGRDNPTEHDYSIRTSWTPCHFGGERCWLHCPNCGRRVSNLFGGTQFLCRHCMQLNYPSQQSSKRDAAITRSWALREQLGCNEGPLECPPEFIPRPKGMHRRTFARRLEAVRSSDLKANSFFSW